MYIVSDEKSNLKFQSSDWVMNQRRPHPWIGELSPLDGVLCPVLTAFPLTAACDLSLKSRALLFGLLFVFFDKETALALQFSAKHCGHHKVPLVSNLKLVCFVKHSVIKYC